MGNGIHLYTADDLPCSQLYYIHLPWFETIWGESVQNVRNHGSVPSYGGACEVRRLDDLSGQVEGLGSWGP